VIDGSIFTTITSYGISLTLIVTLISQILSNRKSDTIALKAIAVNYVDFWMRDPFVSDLQDAKNAFIDDDIKKSKILVQSIWAGIADDKETYKVITRNAKIKQNAEALITMLALLLEDLSPIVTLPASEFPEDKSPEIVRDSIPDRWVVIAKCHKNLISRIKEEILHTDLVYHKITQKYIPLRNAVPSKK